MKKMFKMLMEDEEDEKDNWWGSGKGGKGKGKGGGKGAGKGERNSCWDFEQNQTCWKELQGETCYYAHWKNGIDINENKLSKSEGKGKGKMTGGQDTGKGWDAGKSAAVEIRGPKVFTDVEDEEDDKMDEKEKTLENALDGNIFSYCRLEKNGEGVRVTGYLTKEAASALLERKDNKFRMRLGVIDAVHYDRMQSLQKKMCCAATKRGKGIGAGGMDQILDEVNAWLDSEMIEEAEWKVLKSKNDTAAKKKEDEVSNSMKAMSSILKENNKMIADTMSEKFAEVMKGAGAKPGKTTSPSGRLRKKAKKRTPVKAPGPMTKKLFGDDDDEETEVDDESTEEEDEDRDPVEEAWKRIWADAKERMAKIEGLNASERRKNGKYDANNPIEGVDVNLMGTAKLDAPPVAKVNMNKEEEVREYMKTMFAKEVFEVTLKGEATEKFANFFQRAHMPAERAVAILKTFGLEVSGKRRTHVLLPMVALAVTRKALEAVVAGSTGTTLSPGAGTTVPG